MSTKHFLLVVFLLLYPLTVAVAAEGETEAIFYTNSNIIITPHPTPDTFTVTESGETFGLTESGVSFSQTNISNDTTRLQKFVIQEAWWYISDKGIIGYGEGISDIQALSIYLSRPENTG
ncbi:MAG: hypothetical protein ACQESA_02890 [Patescibacteria group bacterium]